MPRKTIDLPQQIEHLSILDQDGNLDEDLEPDLSDETLLRMHRTMVLSRHFDERLLKLQRSGRIGTFAPVKGQEASQVGAAAALNDDDWMVPSYREMAVSMWRGTPLAGLILYIGGYQEGGRPPDEQRDLPISIPVTSQIPHAVGIAYAAKVRGEESAAMVFFGDGATSGGDFHEGMNFAMVYGTPTVFLCQNNQYAISVPREKQTASKTIAQKAIAYGMPGLQVDGNDVLAVYAAAREAVERARAGDGPTFIECVTYRLWFHTTADDPDKYRDEEEVEQWKKRDPIPRFEKYLKGKDLISDDDIEKLYDEVEEEIDAAWKEAEGQMEELDDPMPMFDHVYAERPPYLEEQRQSFSEYRESAS